MWIVRICKVALVVSVALFFTAVSLGNITDYGTNWAFVQHVMSMDTIFPNSDLHWRAITSPAWQTAFYWLIIAGEILTAILLWIGAFHLVAAARTPGFGQAKTVAISGLSLGFLLYAIGFVVIGGEWFAMWQSTTWNGAQSAFEFIGMIGVVLIVLLIPEPA